MKPAGELGKRIGALGGANPEWRAYLALVSRTVAALQSEDVTVDVERPAAPEPGAPYLAGATIHADARALARSARPLVGRVDILPLVESVLSGDDGRALAAAGIRTETAPRFLSALALAVMPLLHACRREVEGHVPAAWSAGFCPLCGAWPALAELRGLERVRRLRCGRCGADWGLPTLLCAFCGNDDHRRLGALVPEAASDARRVETCEACRAYLKTVPTLSALAPEAVLVEDLATVELDLVALERGFSRPVRPGHLLRVRVVEAGRAGRGAPGRRR